MSDDQELLSGAALAVFKLTAAWWQILGAVLPEPLPVAGIAREMGITRQSVQRIADLLVERGLAEYRDNPAHRRAKLLAPTAEGRAAVRRIGPAHATAAHALAGKLGADRFADILDGLRDLSTVLDTVHQPG
jgi:DNA-binding MarR family transcriptional regulator